MTVGILGLGLIGGSLARAYAKAGHRVYACEKDETMLEFAQLAGAVQGTLSDDKIPECDLILLAIYPGGSSSWLEEKAPLISKDALVLDCCGVKSEICSRCFPVAREYGFTFVGGHPMAGSHNSGFKYSRSNLFQGAPMVLVPERFDDMALLQRVKDALEPCRFGSFSVTTATDHDRMIAFTSQMPHILSNAFIKSPTALEHKGFSAGSYKDLTRVAWLNPGMWAELFLSNKDNLLFELDRYLENLQAYRNALESADAETLIRLLEQGRRRKEGGRRMKTIHVTASRSYDIYIGDGLLKDLGQYVSMVTKAQQLCIVSDDTVWPIYGGLSRAALEKAGFSCRSFVFPAGEKSKNGQVYLGLLNFLAENHFTRADCLVALGGGVVGDLTGFAAATYLRGIDFIQVPTTVLAAVDSSVGGKTAIDLEAGKNLAGAFYQPSLVVCDLEAFDTLPPEIFRDGCAEIIKYGVLFDPVLFGHLCGNGLNFDREAVVARCVELKRDVVAKDEFDRGERQLLNLGHTLGHGVEACSGFEISHGSAVATGMAMVARASAALGFCQEECCRNILHALDVFGLPQSSPYSAGQLLSKALSDKKRAGETVNLIVPEKIGLCKIMPTPIDRLQAFIEAGL